MDKQKLADDYYDMILEFQGIVEELATQFHEKPEEVIRKLVNTKWDIRECLNYKDIVLIVEAESENRKKHGSYKGDGIPAEL